MGQFFCANKRLKMMFISMNNFSNSARATTLKLVNEVLIELNETILNFSKIFNEFNKLHFIYQKYMKISFSF